MAFQGRQSHALISTYSIYKPEVRAELTKKFPRPSALSWLRALGRVKKRPRVSRQMTYSFYEEGNYFNSVVTIESNAPDSANVDVTIEEADHFQTGTASFPIVGDLAVFTDETVGYVISIDRTSDDNHIIKIGPITAAGNDVNAAAVDTEKISFFSSAEGERSSAPETRVPQVTEFTGQMQIIRESF